MLLFLPALPRPVLWEYTILHDDAFRVLWKAGRSLQSSENWAE